jgi:hypothetical protein
VALPYLNGARGLDSNGKSLKQRLELGGLGDRRQVQKEGLYV